MILNTETVKQLQPGDYFEYLYPANDINTHHVINKCIYLGVSEVDENKHSNRNNVVMVKCVKLRNLNTQDDTFGEIEDTCITIPSDVVGNDFMVWRNKWNRVQILRINNKIISEIDATA